MIQTDICRACGCSLVRLGIGKEQAAERDVDGGRHLFCCEGCAEVFVTAPERYLRETEDLVVCPTCLAEKPRASTVALVIGETEVHFCRCPYCVELFQRNPELYTQRLQGVIPYAGVFGDGECCGEPLPAASSGQRPEA